jgi:hypothetical protein
MKYGSQGYGQGERGSAHVWARAVLAWQALWRSKGEVFELEKLSTPCYPTRQIVNTINTQSDRKALGELASYWFDHLRNSRNEGNKITRLW